MNNIERITLVLSVYQINIEEFNPELHDLEQLTLLLHRSYKRLSEMGLEFWASSQPVEKTSQRIENGKCLVALHEGRLIGTICFYPTIKAQDSIWFKKESEWYKRPDVGRFGQFAVDPDYQKVGLGRRLLKEVELLAISEGKQHLALDTSDQAAHLLYYYEGLGFKHIEYIQWDNVNYRSTVMSKPISITNTVSLRKATRADCSRLLELIYELAVYEKAPEKVTVGLAEFEDAGFGDKPVWNAIVAEQSGLIIGFALYYTRYSTWTGCRLYLEDFYVSESHRGFGVGRLLFDRIIETSVESGYNGMTWQVLDWNTTAINFYKKYDAELDPEWLNGSLSKDQLKKIYERKMTDNPMA